MVRIVICAVLAAIAVVLLLTTGWVAALVFVFVVGIADVVMRLLIFAGNRADEHGGWRIDQRDR